jgi:hypothetical protein
MADEGESVEIQADPIAASPLVQEILALLRKSYDHAPYQRKSGGTNYKILDLVPQQN